MQVKEPLCNMISPNFSAFYSFLSMIYNSVRSLLKIRLFRIDLGILKSYRRLAISILLFLTISSFNNMSSQTTYVSAMSGKWHDGTTWIGGVVPGTGDDAVISTGTTVTLEASGNATIRNLTINTEGVLNTDNRIMTINGDLVVDGTITSKNSAVKDLEFNGSNISGSGIILIAFDGKYFNVNNDATILGGSYLILDANIRIGSGKTLTNNGRIEVARDIVGNSAASVFTNGVNAYLAIGDHLMTTGVLNASAGGNTVEYQGDPWKEIQSQCHR